MPRDRKREKKERKEKKDKSSKREKSSKKEKRSKKEKKEKKSKSSKQEKSETKEISKPQVEAQQEIPEPKQDFGGMSPEQMFAKMQAMMAEMDSLKSGKKDSSTGMAPSKQSGVPPTVAKENWSTAAYQGHSHVETIPQEGQPRVKVSSGCNTVFTNISNMVERVIEVYTRPVDIYQPEMTLPSPGTCHAAVNTSITNDNKGAGRVIDLVHLRARRQERVVFQPKLTPMLTSAVDILPAQQPIRVVQEPYRPEYRNCKHVQRQTISQPMRETISRHLRPEFKPQYSAHQSGDSWSRSREFSMPKVKYNPSPTSACRFLHPQAREFSQPKVKVSAPRFLHPQAGAKKSSRSKRQGGDVWDRMDNYINWLHTTSPTMEVTRSPVNSVVETSKTAFFQRYGDLAKRQ